MTAFTREQLDKQWDAMSERLREAVYSPAYAETIFGVARDHYFSKEKTEYAMRLIGYIMFGLLHTEELDEELVMGLGVPRAAAREFAEEIDRKLFSQFRDDINQIYAPALEKAGEAPTPLSSRGGSSFGGKSGFPTPSKPDFAASSDLAAGEPLILHTEESEELKKPEETVERKGFTLSPFGGGFFDKKSSPAKTGGRQAMPIGRQAARVVHYSEHRTPLGPVGLNGPGFIDLSKIGSSVSKSRTSDVPQPKPGPEVEGNTVDLRP